jgi:hypothetical protein
VLAGSFLLFTLALRLISPSHNLDQEESNGAFLWISITGLAALFLAGTLYWALGIPIQQEFPWDRPLLSFIPGAAITTSVVATRILIPKYRSAFLAALCAMALIANANNARTYIEEWREMRSYVDQLTRRVPQVLPGTILLTQDLPFLYYGENTFLPILNWTYQPDAHTPQMRLRMFDLAIRQGEATTRLESGDLVSQNYRSFRFESSKDQVLAYAYQPPGCLHVLFPDEGNYPYLPKSLKDLVYLSKPGLILADAGRVTGAFPVNVDSEQPAWCAYYEQADLARQFADWDGIRAAAGEAEKLGLHAQVGYEYWPFIEAYARGGDWEQVNHYTSLAKTADSPGNAYLCSRWKKIAGVFEQARSAPVTAQFCSD